MNTKTGILVALAVLALVGVGAAGAAALTSHPQTSAYGGTNGGMGGGYGGGMMGGGGGMYGGGMMGGTGGCGCSNTQYCQQYMANHTYDWDHNSSYGMMP